MKKPQIFRITLAFIVLGLAFSACEEEREYDELYYVENSTVSSSDPDFTDYDGEKIIHFSISGGEVTLNVNCGTKWYADNSNPNIFAVTVTSKSLTITAYKNLVGEELTGTITLRTVESDMEFATITIIQDGPAYINLGDEELLVSKFEGSTSVTVKSNFDWDYSYDSSNSWLTIEKSEDGKSLIISYTENETGADREGVVTVTAGDGATNSARVELKITQSWEDIDSLILEYTITSSTATTSIKLPIYNVTDATIDWGDGTVETTSSSRPSHKYYAPGTYTVTVSGVVERLYGRESSDSISGARYLTAVKQWGNTGLTDMSYAFYNCYNLDSLPDDTGRAFKNVTSFSYAFSGCSSFTTFPENIFSGCNVATDFSHCFDGCTKLATVPENIFSGCDAATDFSRCFGGCTRLTTVPEKLFSNCSTATSFGGCFYGCTSLTSIPAGLFDNCTAATSFYSCFYGAALANVPENLFSNCAATTDFRLCFEGCTKLTTVPENIFSGCDAATDFSCCFGGCTKLTTVPENIFSSCESATDFSCCFEGCTKLATVPEKLFSNCAEVTTFYRTFYNCSSLTSAPSFEGCANAITFEGAFYGCESLSVVPENIFAGCTSATSFYQTFAGCLELTTVPKNMFLECPSAMNFYQTFYRCTSLTSAPTFEGCTNVTTFSHTFTSCKALTDVPKNIFSGCTNVTSFYATFYNCSSLTDIPDDLFAGCSLVNSFCYVFCDCSSLKTIPVNLFDDCLLVTEFVCSFASCSSVVGESPYTEIDVNGTNNKVHLYERKDYAEYMGCSTPSSNWGCFGGECSFSDINSIPSGWK